MGRSDRPAAHDGQFTRHTCQKLPRFAGQGLEISGFCLTLRNAANVSMVPLRPRHRPVCLGDILFTGE
jgi:hypothetical protein